MLHGGKRCIEFQLTACHVYMLLLCPHCIETGLVGINSEHTEMRAGQAKQNSMTSTKHRNFEMKINVR